MPLVALMPILTVLVVVAVMAVWTVEEEASLSSEENHPQEHGERRPGKINRKLFLQSLKYS